MFWLRNKKNNFQIRTLIWGSKFSDFKMNPHLVLRKYFVFLDMHGSRGGGVERGSGPNPLKNHKNIVFFSNIDPDLLKNYIFAKPAFIVGPPWARQ